MDWKLKNGIKIVLITNIINMVFSLATNFLLPKLLPIDTYAYIKEYQLYISFVGLLHFGYVDGVYLKWGGKELRNGSSDGFKTVLVTLFSFELVVAAIVSATAFILSNELLLFFAISIVPVNMNFFYQYLYQATGNFKRYGKIMNLSTVLSFALNLMILFVFRIESARIIVGLYAILYYVVWIIVANKFNSLFLKGDTSKGQFSFGELVSNIKNGIFLTVGNLASVFLSSMDRLFVKNLLHTWDFAYYSFAVSVEGLLNVAMTPVTTSLFNFFCRVKDRKKYAEVTSFVILFSGMIPFAAFAVLWVINLMLKNYQPTDKIIVLLFSTQMICFIIKSIFVNLYKSQNKQHVYFGKLVIVIGLGFVLNCISYLLTKSNEGFAIATLISAVFWFFISYFDFRDIGIRFTDIVFLFIQVTAFVCCGCFCSSLYGCVIYFCTFLLSGFVLMKEQYLLIFSKIRAIMGKAKT